MGIEKGWRNVPVNGDIVFSIEWGLCCELGGIAGIKGTKSGGLYVYECPSLSSYSWFRGHSQKVQAIKNVRGGGVSISSQSIRVHAHGGRPKLTHDDIEGNLSSMALDPTDGAGRGSKLVLGRTTGVVSIFDLRTSQYLSRGSVTDSAIGCMETVVSGMVACGMSSGRILLLDPRSGLKVKHQVLGHRGGIVDIASKHNLLVSCGFDIHAGSLVVDSFIKVYDARSLRESLSSVNFPAGPSYLEFHPKFSSTLVIASTADVIGLQEIQADSIPMTLQVNTDNSGLLSFAISSSGDLFALGGGRGMLRLEASSRHATVNLMSAPHNRPRTNPCPSVSLLEDDPFHLVPQHPSITGRLLSDWDLATVIDVGRPPRIVDETIAGSLFQADYFGHGPNPKICKIREHVAPRHLWSLRNARVERQPEPLVVASQNEAQSLSPMNIDASSPLPDMYYPVEIKRSVQKRFEEFDFGLYNDTRMFSGLENGIPNSYCNALLQVLFFHPAFRKAILERQPDASQEIALLDEMTFLFRMLADGPAAPCQASNLLRALHHVQEAGALGLLDDSSGRKVLSLSEKISNLYKFIMEKLHREWKNSSKDTAPSPMEAIFGIKSLIHTKCLNGEKAERRQSMTSFLVEFPCLEELEEPPSSLRFCDMLQASLQSNTVLQAWFDESHGDQHVRQTKMPAGVGEVLVVSCSTLEALDAAPSRYRGTSTGGQTHGRQIPSLLGIRHIGGRGELCLSEGETLESLGLTQDEVCEIEARGESNDVAVFELTGMIANVCDEHSNDGKGNLVAHVKVPAEYLQCHQGIQRLVDEIPSPTKAPFWDSRGSDAQKGGNALGSLIGPTNSGTDVISDPVVLLPETEGEVSRIADLNDSMTGAQDSGASGESSSPDSPNSSCGSGPIASSSSASKQWLLVNDFSLVYTNQEEVQNLYGGRKSPCLLFYSKRRAVQAGNCETQVQMMPVMDHWEFCELCGSRPLQGLNARMHLAAFKPLEFATEVPRPGSLFALDAEFVVPGPTSGIGLSGCKKDNTTRMILGRVSVVRGEGPMAGVCCIDDYVRPLETVQDYLTRFSGLVEGDLDANTSQHYLTTLKHVYMKLRYLVDCGCIFVGHGLKMDFRIINIVVPPNQIIDTVELFHLKHHRMFSLRFLASYLLKLDIQSSTHDSIEDARTALQLYEMYNKLVKEGVFETRLREMYMWGNQYGWEPGFWIMRPGEIDERNGHQTH